MSKYKIEKSEDEWMAALDPESFKILRKKGTEMPHTGKYNLHFDQGIYRCKGCNTQLFASDMKFESGCGWPTLVRRIVAWQADPLHRHGLTITCPITSAGRHGR